MIETDLIFIVRFLLPIEQWRYQKRYCQTNHSSSNPFEHNEFSLNLIIPNSADSYRVVDPFHNWQRLTTSRVMWVALLHTDNHKCGTAIYCIRDATTIHSIDRARCVLVDPHAILHCECFSVSAESDSVTLLADVYRTNNWICSARLVSHEQRWHELNYEIDWRQESTAIACIPFIFCCCSCFWCCCRTKCMWFTAPTPPYRFVCTYSGNDGDTHVNMWCARG